MRGVTVIGVTFADGTRHEALAQLERLIGVGCSSTVFFVNAHTLNLAAGDPGYRTTLNGATAVFGDGTGVRWAARMRGLRLLDNLNGTDLVPDFLRRQTGIRCFLVGSAPDRIGRAAETFRQLFPNSVL